MQITTTSLAALVAEYGVRNVFVEIELDLVTPVPFLCGIGLTNGQSQRVMAHITENRYTVADKYKVSFAYDTPENSGLIFGVRHMYQSDFETIWGDGRVAVYVQDIDGFNPVTLNKG